MFIEPDSSLPSTAQTATGHGGGPPRRHVVDVVLPLQSHDQFGARVDRDLALCRRHGDALAVLVMVVDEVARISPLGQPDQTPVEPALVADLQRELGRRLRGRVRGTDLVARLGEQEVGVVLYGAGQTEADIVMARLCLALTGPYRFGSVLLGVRLHIGHASYPGQTGNGRHLLDLAGQALVECAP